MKKIWIKILPIVFLCIIVILLVSKNIINNDTTEQEEKNEVKELEINILNNRTDELVFSFSINDFIDSYNSFYWKDKKRTYLRPATEWQILEYDRAIHSNHETYYYHFMEDEKNWTLPTMTVYVPSNEDYVQEVTLNFDDHSYTDQMYDLYEEMCFYTLKVFFHDLTDEQITELYETLNQLARDNIFPNEKGYDNNPTPCALYYRDGIGIYPYFAIGQSLRLCIIPVTQQTIHTFEEKEVDIYKI